MAFRVGDVLGLICSHPIASIAVLLLFTPPLFPIVVYFSPLLISTALVVLAMVSMGSHVEPEPHNENEVHYKRGWIEDVSDEGPELEDERESKRLRSSSKEDRWLDKMKNWEGTGRAWMESVLSQESRANSSSDHTGTSKSDSRPLSAAKELHTQESNEQVRGNEQKLTRREEDQETIDSANQSALTVLTLGSSEVVDGKPGELTKVGRNVDSEITANVQLDNGTLEDSSESTPSSPLFRSRSASRREAGDPNTSRELKVEDVGSVPADDSSNALQIVCSSSAPEKGKEKGLASHSDTENDATPLVKKDKAESSSKVDGSGVAQTLEIVPFEGEHAPETPLLDQEKAHDSFLDKEHEKKPVAPDSTAEGSATDKPYSIGTAQVLSIKPSRSGTDLLRQGKTTDADSPSAAVALSEKLKVPLADIMSLLTGDEKENANLDSGSGMKASTSSESTTSQEEEWSSSDGDSVAPANKSNELKSSAEQ